MYIVNIQSKPGKFRSGKFTLLYLVGGAKREDYDRWREKNAAV